jgi:hypothetical protein
VCGVVGFRSGSFSGFVAGIVLGGPSCPHTEWHCRVVSLEQLGEYSTFKEGRCLDMPIGDS